MRNKVVYVSQRDQVQSKQAVMLWLLAPVTIPQVKFALTILLDILTTVSLTFLPMFPITHDGYLPWWYFFYLAHAGGALWQEVQQLKQCVENAQADEETALFKMYDSKFTYFAPPKVL